MCRGKDFQLNVKILFIAMDKCRNIKPLLAFQHKTLRVNFTEEHEKKPDEYLEHILWSDEGKINLFGSDEVQCG